MRIKNLVLAAIVTATIGCSNAEEPIIVTVQETNVDDGPTCEHQSQTVDANRSCDQVNVAITLCSVEAVCAPQLDEIKAMVESCEIDVLDESFSWQPLVDC